jgi:hypothetical protein
MTQRKYSLNHVERKGDYMICPDGAVVFVCIQCGSWMVLGKVHHCTNAEPLHMMPSIICPAHGCHYFV